jgi:ABC-type multidrug transport system fused ATPase/permease subunit
MVVLRILGWICFEIGGQIACLDLFKVMMDRLGQTRTTFFDEHPSGRIINRTVRDFDQLRFMGPVRLGDSFNALVELFVIAVLIGVAHPAAGLAVLPTLAIFLYVQSQVAPMLQRGLTLRSVRFGEVLHRETDAIEGIRTFVLYGEHQTLFRRLRKAMEQFAQMHILRTQVEAWGRFWSQIASALCALCALIAVAIGVHTQSLSIALAAVVVTAVFRLGGTFGWLTWSLGYLFESAGQARRIFEYVDLPSEESTEHAIPRDSSPVPADQPKAADLPKGDLVFDRYTMSYRSDTPVIINELSLTICAGAHVGIVGRTGAGKSSLVQALFRMVQVRGGDITVGGRSIFDLPIERARALFTVVPQDPYLFVGTVRSNLDPENMVTDAALTEALSAVQLPLELSAPIAEGGKNLSLGQRQLIALARALVSTAPFVVMDEPTSSVDSITDAIVQRVLQISLRGRTIITIAHRLETLSLVDQIVEMDAGRVRQVGTPQELLPKLSAAALG